MVERFADKATVVYEQIGRRIAKSSSVGADETGVNINGKNHWAWVFQDEFQTHITIDASRSKAAIDRIFTHGLPCTTLTHDCWKPYFKMDVASHQICTAHLLRELKYLDKLYPQAWAQNFTQLLLDAIDFKRELRPCHYYYPMPERDAFNARLELLINSRVDPAHEKLVAFQNRMVRYKDHLFRFLHQHNVALENNASERAVRTFKVKLKVSGLFRSTEGAKRFAIIRSVIDTTLKNSMKVFQALVLIAESG